MRGVVSQTWSRTGLAVGVAIAVIVATAIAYASTSGSNGRHTTRIGATFAAGDIATLVRRSTAIAVVEPTGHFIDHWNNAENAEWGELGVDSYIYRDSAVRLVRALRGNLPSTITVRGLGGTVADVSLEFEAGATEWVAGDQYLVFLEVGEFPTREGSEPFWTPVRLGQGVFERTESGWRDSIQFLEIADDELRQLTR